ncbi:MAG: hypothetical protein ABI954_13485 [Pyrinomonadaceae bacterium]
MRTESKASKSPCAEVRNVVWDRLSELDKHLRDLMLSQGTRGDAPEKSTISRI